jgi:hypothetical protein
MYHLSKIACELNETDFPFWITQTMLVDLTVVATQYQGLSEMQNEPSVSTLFNIKGTMTRLCDETEMKYPN